MTIPSPCPTRPSPSPLLLPPCADAPLDRPHALDRADPRLPRILRHIETHIDDPELDAERLRRAFGLSRPTLYRMFRRIGGISRYIRERRLLAAYHRLHRDPECSITWLLYDLGFDSERQFQRAFRAYFGLAPAQWRERCRAEAPAPRRRRP